MQVLERGGFRILGEKFPADWKKLVEKANPRGYYESTLVQGINYHTNPDPRSGAWMPPEMVTDVAVKVFADGLVKTDFSYINRVILTVRNWQECEASQKRMDSIRAENDAPEETDENSRRAARLPVGYAWWKAYFSLLRDMQTRRYPAAAFAYASLLQDPEKVIGAAFHWLGAGDATAAVGAVDRSLRTQNEIALPDVDHDHGDVFDELYDTLCNSQRIEPALYQKFAETDRRISQEIDAILAHRENENGPSR